MQVTLVIGTDISRLADTAAQDSFAAHPTRISSGSPALSKTFGIPSCPLAADASSAGRHGRPLTRPVKFSWPDANEPRQYVPTVEGEADGI